MIQESILFCSIYFENMESKINRPYQQWDSPDRVQSTGLRLFTMPVRPIGACDYVTAGDEIHKMHWTILNNSEDVRPYVRYVCCNCWHPKILFV